MFNFEWDTAKAKTNIEKHGVTFDEAVSVFVDEFAVTVADTDHWEDEDRSRPFGYSSKQRILVVVHTERRNGVRIISARKATENEKNFYRKR